MATPKFSNGQPTNPDREPATVTRPGSLCALRLVDLADVLANISSADLLLFRRRRGLIAIAGRGIHSHAGMAAWWNGCLMLIESTWPRARAITLENAVARYPGRIDVYRANPGGRWKQFDREATVAAMRSLCGRRYPLLSLLRVALYHLPFARFLFRPGTDDAREDDWRKICSQSQAWATRTGGGVDPVENLEDRSTEPADLARSPFYAYQFTLR